MIDREAFYAEMREDLKRATTFFRKEDLLTTTVLEDYWLDDCCDMQYDEGDRIIALMPLIKWQIENNNLSESCDKMWNRGEHMLVERIKTVDRVYEINNILLQKLKTVYRLRKICVGVFGNKFEYAYVISLAKDHKKSIEEMVEDFYALCKSILLDREILITNNKCFKIVSDEFEVTYYIEAWRKTADKLAYVENGKGKTELIHRMSCEQAASIYRKLNVKPFNIINTADFLKQYDNHADKYVALAKRASINLIDVIDD